MPPSQADAEAAMMMTMAAAELEHRVELLNKCGTIAACCCCFGLLRPPPAPAASRAAARSTDPAASAPLK